MVDMDKVNEAMEKAAVAAAIEKAAHSHDAIWGYDKVVAAALDPYLPEDKALRREFLVAVQSAARSADSGKIDHEWTGYTIVANILSSRIAWLTPGWAEARQYLT